jgi:galactokinase
VSFVPSLASRPICFPDTRPKLSFVVAQSFVQSEKHTTAPVCYNLRVVECSLAASYLYATLKLPEPLAQDASPLGISLRSFQESYCRDDTTSEPARIKKTRRIIETLLKEDGYTRDDISTVLGISTAALREKFESKFSVRAEHFKLRQRSLHVLDEAERVLEFTQLLESPEQFIAPEADDRSHKLGLALGKLMNETQTSCRELYECSCPEIDALCRIARASGSYGSRVTGAGWGGCTVHLVPSDKIEAVKQAWEREYYSKLDLSQEQKDQAVVVSRPAGGSAVLSLIDGQIS